MHLVFCSFVRYTYCCNATAIVTVTVTVSFILTSFFESWFLFVPFCRLVKKLTTRHTVFHCPLVLSSRFIPSISFISLSFSLTLISPLGPASSAVVIKRDKQRGRPVFTANLRIYADAYQNTKTKKNEASNKSKNPVAGYGAKQDKQ